MGAGPGGIAGRSGLHLRATLQAALVRRAVTAGSLLPLAMRDLRQPIREDRGRLLYVFLVDASGSMGARRRMAVTKGAIYALIERAYQQRDRVAVLAFRGTGAEVWLPPTNSLRFARRRLDILPTGGRTPLAAGLLFARDFVRWQRRRLPAYEPVLVVLSDGRANVAPPGSAPLAAAWEAAGRVRHDSLPAIVIDTEEGFTRLGLAARLAEALQAPLLPVESLTRLVPAEASA